MKNFKTNKYLVKDLAPKSQLVHRFFDMLINENIDFTVMNNYEQLPMVIPSDIDMAVSSKTFSKLDELIDKFAKLYSYSILQKLWHGNLKCAYILEVGDLRKPEFVQLDFFVNFSTKGAPNLLSYEVLSSNSKPLRNFNVPDKNVELYFIIMRRLFKNDWSARHCERVRELSEGNDSDDSRFVSYQWLCEVIELASYGDVSRLHASRNNNWKRLKSIANKNLGFLGLIRNFIFQSWRIIYRLRHPTGQILIIKSDFVTSADVKHSFSVLDDVFYDRMFLDAQQLSKLSFVGTQYLLLKIFMSKFRKGLSIILCDSNSNKPDKFSFWLKCFGAPTVTYELDYDVVSSIESISSGSSELLDIIKSDILQSQVEITAKSMANSKSQTGGIRSVQ